MSTKFIRFVAVLAVIVNVVGNTGIAHADHSTPPSISAQNQKPLHAPESQPLDIPAQNIPSVSSLGVQFVHVATVANTAWDTTTIDHPLTNGNPNAIILVTPNFTPGDVGGTNNSHPIGVQYAGGKWLIFNQDGAQIQAGAAFNVIIPTAGVGVFVHTTPASSGYHTLIDNALTNGHPNAIVFVTPNYDPGGVCGCVYANFPIGVRYESGDHKWAIFNQNGPFFAIPDYASFNVFVLTAGAGTFVHTATAGNTSSDHTYIDNPLTNGHPNAIVFITQDFNPGGTGGTYDNHPIGVFYTGGKWAIYDQDGVDVPLTASFNVLVLVPSSNIFVHTTTADNGGGVAPYTLMDNALTNGHSNAIVFTTPNFNPGGVGGTGHNHNINMYYNGSQWAILNQDAVYIPVGVAFNVLVPDPDTSVFVHKATAVNILSHSTVIDYPLTNGKPDAIILVTPNFNPGGVGGTYDSSPIGVFYDGSKWRIFNQSGAAMPVGAAFNVFIPTAGAGVFVHKNTSSYGDSTFINNPLTNDNPNAIVIVTPNWNPGGVGGTNDNHPIGVKYSGSHWFIFNQDGVAMPLNAAFNVYVFDNYKLYLPLVIR